MGITPLGENMPHLIPQMPPEPPEDFVAFVGRHLSSLCAEAGRLVGDDGHADEVYPDALTDVAARWGWFDLVRPLTGPEVRTAYLRRSLAVRARRWRDEQPYPVEVRWADPYPDDRWTARPAPPPPAPPRPAWTSVALLRAPLLGPTARGEARPVAEAAIAWSHAYRRRRRQRLVALLVLVVFAYGALASITGSPTG